MGFGGEPHAPAASIPGKKTPVPIVQEAGLGGRTISYPPGFDSGPSNP